MSSLPYCHKFPKPYHGDKKLYVYNNDNVSMNSVLMSSKINEISAVSGVMEVHNYLEMLKNNYSDKVSR